MKHVLVIDLTTSESVEQVAFLGHDVELKRVGCGGDVMRAQGLIAGQDGKVDAIALEGLPTQVRLGPAVRPHRLGSRLPEVAQQTPIVDGSGLRDAIERWAIMLADRAQPGIFAEKRILMVPGFNHSGLAHALRHHSDTLRYADPVTHFNLPALPGVSSPAALEQAAGPWVERLKEFPFARLHPTPGPRPSSFINGPFAWADVLAGDIGTIRRHAPPRLERKTVVAEWAAEEDADDLARRGAAILVTLMPSLDGPTKLGRSSAAVIEALLVATRPEKALPLTEDTYLDLVAEMDWAPAIRYFKRDEAEVNRFAFVIHPLNIGFIHKYSWLKWTRVLPDELVETAAAYLPPVLVSRVTGACSKATGQRVEGFLISLGATPRQMMTRGVRFTYERLNKAARMAERLGARIMGLGAFTSVVGDAGVTVAHEADIAVTSGNSLTVAATLEAAKQAAVKMGAADLTKGKAMVVGATGSIGAVCARLIAQAIGDVVLVSIEPEKLIDLKRRIQQETPGARVRIATRTEEAIADCDLIVTATSAFGQRVIDITRCKPGSVICDVARPPDISRAEAALRPDVLVIESGEVLIPGDVDLGYDIGLPRGTAYACLAETCLLAMEGRFEDYTLGRNIEMERVKEIYRLFKKHGFKLAGLRSFGQYLTDDDLAGRRALADVLRHDAQQFARMQQEAAQVLPNLPRMSKGVAAGGLSPKTAAWVVASVGAASWALARTRRRSATASPRQG